MPVATADALTGLGVPAQLAAILGGNPSQLTCVGTTQAGAAVVKSTNTELLTAGGATACVIPALAEVMVPYVFTNPTSTAGLIFVPLGHTIITNTASTLNGSVGGAGGLLQNKSAVLWQYKPKFWACILTA